MPGKDEQAGGIPVQAVDGPVGEGFPFLAVIPGHGIGQGIVIMTLGRVDGDPGRLVDPQYILILIYNGCLFYTSFGKMPLVRITFGGYRWNTMKQVLLVGLSPFLIIASDSLLIIVMNMIIRKFSNPADGDMLLTCNTIVQSFMLLITMPLGGITGGTQTVLGYNYGAGRPDRIRKAEKHIVFLGLAFTAVMFVIAQTAPGYFVRIFTRDESYVGITEWAIRMYTLAVIPLAVQYTVVYLSLIHI